ncbi:MAG: ParB/RepB/Spo0J family partition protein [Chloroflexota bacterium]|nr:MAG: chromosome partitioning protein ParB [Bellilinea sp.]
MTRKSGLGKGLDALIPGNQPSAGEGNIQQIPIEAISANPYQPRHEVENQHLEELAESIRQHGILQPIIVTRDPFSGQYALIAGERRLRAARLAGLERVPAIVRLASEQQRLELALIENLQRTDLGPLETAQAYQRLSDEFGLSHEEIAIRVGKSRAAVTNTLRLLKLPESVQKALANGSISEGHARALLQLPTPQAQIAVLQMIIERGLSVRQTEELTRKYSGERPPRSAPPDPMPEIRSLEEKLRQHLGTRVTLQHGKKGGKLIIHYYSNEELNTLLDQLLRD